MRLIVKLTTLCFMLLSVACVKQLDNSVTRVVTFPDHIQEYQKATSIVAMPPSPFFHYEDRYRIPKIEARGALLGSHHLIIPPGSHD